MKFKIFSCFALLLLVIHCKPDDAKLAAFPDGADSCDAQRIDGGVLASLSDDGPASSNSSIALEGVIDSGGAVGFFGIANPLDLISLEESRLSPCERIPEAIRVKLTKLDAELRGERIYKKNPDPTKVGKPIVSTDTKFGPDFLRETGIIAGILRMISHVPYADSSSKKSKLLSLSDRYNEHLIELIKSKTAISSDIAEDKFLLVLDTLPRPLKWALRAVWARIAVAVYQAEKSALLSVFKNIEVFPLSVSEIANRYFINALYLRILTPKLASNFGATYNKTDSSQLPPSSLDIELVRHLHNVKLQLKKKPERSPPKGFNFLPLASEIQSTVNHSTTYGLNKKLRGFLNRLPQYHEAIAKSLASFAFERIDAKPLPH